MSDYCPTCGQPQVPQLSLANPAPETKARRSDPTTSQLAAWRARPKAHVTKGRLLAAFAEAYPCGLTAEEASEKADVIYVTASTRITELRKGGWLFITGEERKTSHGQPAEVLALTGRAREELGLAGTAAPDVAERLVA